MAEQSGESMPKVLDNAIEAYRRQKFLEQANAAYRALKSNAKSWKEERAEREAWNATLADGLEGD